MSDFEWNRILHGDVLAKIGEIPDNSIDCCVCSPPYYGVRDYKVEGQYGLEPTFHEYIDKMVGVFEALRPKLCDYGSIWVNLGDTYYGGGNAQGHTGLTTNLGKSTLQRGGNQNPVARGTLLPRKTLIGIPDRFKIAMIDSGWICRNDIIWYKRSTMPSSARDRFTVDYERFFFFTKKPKYYFKQQFEIMNEDTFRESKRESGNNPKGAERQGLKDWKINPLGRNKRTVWDINPAQFKEAHFATFPEKLIEIPIDASCPKLVCTKCDKPQEQIIKFSGGTTGEGWHQGTKEERAEQGMMLSMNGIGRRANEDGSYKKEIMGWSKCDCKAPFRKGRVLDPFMGAGTTALVAHKQGKDWLGIELKEEYIKIAERRLLNNTDILLQQHFSFEE